MSVLLEPVPATTGTRPFATRTTVSTTSRSSSSLIAGVSPVVPQGTRPLTPCWIWNSTMPSSASTSTSSFLNGVTRAVNVPLNISLLQFEVLMKLSDRFFNPLRRYDACYLNLRGRDHPYGDARLAQRGEHSRRVSGTVEHPGPHDRDLAEVLFTLDRAAQKVGHLARDPPRLREVAAPHGEGDVRHSPFGPALDDDVYGDAPFGQRDEDAAQGSGPGADAVQGYARDVQVVDDTGQGFAGLQLLQVLASRYHRARSFLKRGADVYLDPVQGSQLDGARVHHLRPAPGHLGHLLRRDEGDTVRPLYYAGVGGVDAVHVGVDLAPLRPSAAASATAVVSEPPRPSVITSPKEFIPWKPATMTTWPSLSSLWIRSGLISEITPEP